MNNDERNKTYSIFDREQISLLINVDQLGIFGAYLEHILLAPLQTPILIQYFAETLF